MENKNEIIEKGIEFYKKYNDAFVKEVKSVYFRFRKSINSRMEPDPKYGDIVSVYDVDDRYVYYNWEESWSYGGHDEGVGAIPIEWLTNTEEEFNKLIEKEKANKRKIEESKERKEKEDILENADTFFNEDYSKFFNLVIDTYKKFYSLINSDESNVDTFENFYMPRVSSIKSAKLSEDGKYVELEYFDAFTKKYVFSTKWITNTEEELNKFRKKCD